MLSFVEFFSLVHGKAPFPWHLRLYEQAVKTGLPAMLKIPSRAERAALVDVWLYCLAGEALTNGREMPRRLFWTYDRRTVMDEVYDRGRKIALAVNSAEVGPLKEFGDLLRQLSGGKSPLIATQIGGSYFMEDIWTKPERPALISGHIDDVMSRLLFRGLGVGFRSSAPQAGLVGNDAWIVLEQPDFSSAAVESLRQIADLRSQHEQLGPFGSTCITAYPVGGADLTLTHEDYSDPELGLRLASTVEAVLVGPTDSVSGLVTQAKRLRKEKSKVIAVFANSVEKANRVAEELRKHGDTILCTGNTRAVDRYLELDPRLRELASASERSECYVVGTQALELGAGLDFDAVATECTSLDTLVTRFGGLNRFGKRKSASAAIVMPKREQLDPAAYGAAQPATWKWLTEHADDKRITLSDRLVEQMLTDTDTAGLFVPLSSAPPLLPQHVDQWVMTNPRPAVEPAVSLWIHGTARGNAEVQVVWRSDLNADNRSQWLRTVQAVPPTSAERLRVNLASFCAWAAGKPEVVSTEDFPTPDRQVFKHDEEALSAQPFFLWRGFESRVTSDLNEIRAGDTIVLPESSGGHDVLGLLSLKAGIDCAELGQFIARRSPVLRLTRETLKSWPKYSQLSDALTEQNFARDAIREALEASTPPECLKEVVAQLTSGGFLFYFHPQGKVLVGRRVDTDRIADPLMKDGEASVSPLLREHCRDVWAFARELAELCWVEPDRVADIGVAGNHHDLGMADPRFQALLGGGVKNPDVLLARSGRDPREVDPRSFAFARYPRGMRHEVVSANILAQYPSLYGEATDRELVDHLISAHHGRCRPLAPVVTDSNPLMIEIDDWQGTEIRVLSDPAADSIGSGITDRFWRLVRRYGWWGLAYYEALFVAAERRKSHIGFDDFASDDNSNGEGPRRSPPGPLPELPPPPAAGPELVLVGLRAGLSLSFLAAIGTLRTLNRLGHDAKLSWRKGALGWNPVLHTELSREDLLHVLAPALKAPPPVQDLDSNFKLTGEQFRELCAKEPEWATALFSEIPAQCRFNGHEVKKSKWMIIDLHLKTNFLRLAAAISEEALSRSLFEEWTSDNADEGCSLRLDPSERQDHALLWAKPGTDGPVKTRHGASRLAIEALPLFPVFPTLRGVTTVGFAGGNGTMSWPIWTQALSLDAIRTLLNLEEISGEVDRRVLSRRGIAEVFRAERYYVGKLCYVSQAAPV